MLIQDYYPGHSFDVMAKSSRSTDLVNREANSENFAANQLLTTLTRLAKLLYVLGYCDTLNNLFPSSHDERAGRTRFPFIECSVSKWQDGTTLCATRVASLTIEKLYFHILYFYMIKVFKCGFTKYKKSH